MTIPEMAPLEWWQLAAFINLAVMQTIFITWWGSTKWWADYIGKAFYFKSLALAVMADTVVVGVFFDWPYEELTKTLIYWAVSAGATIQLGAFARKRMEVKRLNGNST